MPYPLPTAPTPEQTSLKRSWFRIVAFLNQASFRGNTHSQHVHLTTWEEEGCCFGTAIVSEAPHLGGEADGAAGAKPRQALRSCLGVQRQLQAVPFHRLPHGGEGDEEVTHPAVDFTLQPNRGHGASHREESPRPCPRRAQCPVSSGMGRGAARYRSCSRAADPEGTPTSGRCRPPPAATAAPAGPAVPPAIGTTAQL